MVITDGNAFKVNSVQNTEVPAAESTQPIATKEALPRFTSNRLSEEQNNSPPPHRLRKEEGESGTQSSKKRWKMKSLCRSAHSNGQAMEAELMKDVNGQAHKMSPNSSSGGYFVREYQHRAMIYFLYGTERHVAKTKHQEVEKPF